MPTSSSQLTLTFLKLIVVLPCKTLLIKPSKGHLNHQTLASPNNYV